MTAPLHNSSRLPRGFAPAIVALLVAFCVPLYRLAAFALHSDLYSYVLLVPLISLFMVWLKREAPPPPPSPPQRKLAALLAAAGTAVGGLSLLPGAEWAPQDSLFLTSLAFALWFAAVCGWFLGRGELRAVAFPLAFLAFLAPLPIFISQSLETFFQYTSAAVAYVFFELAGMPVLERGPLGFQLPGMNLEVAPQCSGIHSSLALVIISLPIGYLLLRSPWKRAALTAAAIPLGIIRNGFRIFTIGELCVRIGPQMIDSYIHRTGGWMFFLLALGPYLLLLLFLARSERTPARANFEPLRA